MVNLLSSFYVEDNMASDVLLLVGEGNTNILFSLMMINVKQST